MTTINIENSKLISKYSEYELKMKFLEFLEKENLDEKIDLYQISINDLSDESRKKLENLESTEFIDY